MAVQFDTKYPKIGNFDRTYANELMSCQHNFTIPGAIGMLLGALYI